MTIHEAIELLTNLELRRRGVWFIGEANAARLGIEALKYIIRLRAFSIQHRNQKLPGETLSPANRLTDEQVKKLQSSPLGREARK